MSLQQSRTLNIIKPTDFKHLRKVVLNRQEVITVINEKITIKGTHIGDLVRYKRKVYYKTYREQEHVMRKFKGAFGINTGIVDWLLKQESIMKSAFGKDFILFVIFHYSGARENRYYIIDPMAIEEFNLKAEYTKEHGEYLETYSQQYFFPISKMGILGYDPRDEVVK